MSIIALFQKIKHFMPQSVALDKRPRHIKVSPFKTNLQF